jgi:8-oxo-dGTP diphosphatase
MNRKREREAMETGTTEVPAPHSVAAGLLVRRDRVLLCHRSADRRWYPDVWDLPGGHIEVGETPTSALARELKEELGLDVTIPSVPELARITTVDFDLRVWLIEHWKGEPVNLSAEEHDAVAWFGPEEIPGLHLAHERYPSVLASALLPLKGSEL